MSLNTRHPSRANPRRVKAAHMQAVAMRLRIKGYNLIEIAEQMDLLDAEGMPNTKAAHALLRDGIKRVRLENVEEFKDLELQRLDALQKVAWRRAANGNLDAMDRVIKIMDRRAKLLGLDAPAKFRMLFDEAEAMAQEAGVNRDDLINRAEQIAGEAWARNAR